MIKLKNPRPIYLKGGNHAILLLHSFTGTVRDVKGLAQRLNNEGFTTYVPSYQGHGLLLEDFVKSDMDDWWQNVLESYKFLKQEGYETISVAGVSLGGLFTLKLLEIFPDIHSGVAMSVPRFKDEAGIFYRLEQYSTRLDKMLGLSEDEHAEQIAHIQNYHLGAQKFCRMIDEIMTGLSQINQPVLIMYGGRDDASYAESAQYIFQKLKEPKQISIISEAGHLMPLGRGQLQTEEMIVSFFCHKNV
ncbi:alpha/beta hydrolase [Macrococcus brunensis]|uniref:alpha/beta hydrolase n=1 Tax=Macrococcus brunensis TaxID=198483 RepID=UPI001EEFBC8F|nr:alpha/beta fold hydrolase [Macrococcus brunensis]ULG74159.1 alpha/beta hydrolase [Macrococcus brunensis]